MKKSKLKPNLSDHRQIIDLTGYKFNRLLVVEFAGVKSKRVYWKCRCDCGKDVIVRSWSLKSGNTKSCGCLVSEGNNKTHGMSLKAEYGVWLSMRNRCYNPSVKGYINYGGRGITVCPEWRDSFDQFYKDMGKKPTPKHSIDRINNDGNYEPGNCRWATHRDQCNNRRGNISLKYNGKTQTPAQWGRELGISRATIIQRLSYGWTVERTLSTPLKYQKKRHILS